MIEAPDSARRSMEALLAVTPLAFVGGLAAMHEVLREVEHRSLGPDEVVVAAVGVAGLSGIAASLGGPRRDAGPALALTFVLTFLAALSCTVVTIVLLGAWELVPHSLGELLLEPGPWVDIERSLRRFADEPARVLMLPVAAVFLTALGAIFSGPYGIVFATAHACLVATMTWARERAALDARAAVGLVVGLAWLGLGLALSATPGVQATALGALDAGTALAMAGALLALFGVAALARRARWLRRVRRGEIAGLRVDTPAPEDEPLPVLFPWGPPGVIVRVERSGAGPFRDVELGAPLLRLRP